MKLSEQIIEDINNEPIILYMKGTKEMPMCGFSSTAINILNMHSVNFKAVNVLENPEIRIKLSEYSKWPTNKKPLLRVKGIFWMKYGMSNKLPATIEWEQLQIALTLF